MAKNKFTVGGLCSGVGGIELGFKQAGFDIAWANDMDHNAMITYEKIIGKNHYIGKKAMPMEEMFKNKLFKKELTKVDVLASGFPCQAFSVAGYRKGFNDERGNVFFRIKDIIKYLGSNSDFPKVLFLENVKNFKSHDNKKTFHKIRSELYQLGYSVFTKILNTSEFTSIPQNRERTFMICFYGEQKWSEFQLDDYKEFNQDDMAKKECPITYSFYESYHKIKKQKTQKIIEFLDRKGIPEKYYYTQEKYPKIYPKLAEAMISNKTFYQWRRVYARENQSNQCPTLTANMGTGGHNVPLYLVDKKKKIIRKLTPKECFRLQGYGNIDLPTNVADGQLYKQAGNSVTVDLIEILAKMIKNCI